MHLVEKRKKTLIKTKWNQKRKISQTVLKEDKPYASDDIRIA